MKLQKIVSRLQELHPKEIDLSLDRIQNLCQRLGNPQDKLKAISIVGTNGKYSTIQAMFAILKEADIKCNIYTSPHIKSINERFVFDHQELNDEELASLFEKIENIACIIRKRSLLRGEHKPFGGIQLIFSGDFCQLKCVNSNSFCFKSSKCSISAISPW